MPRFSNGLLFAALALGAIVARGATAGDPPSAPPGGQAPPADGKAPPPASGKAEAPPADPAPKEADYKGPEIHWAMSFPDAIEEAVQRNIPLYLHSHGST